MILHLQRLRAFPAVFRSLTGLTVAAFDTLLDELLPAFDAALQQVAHEWLDAATLARRLATDGPLAAEYFTVETMRALAGQVWGQAFEAPVFVDEVEVVSQRLVGEKHLKLTVRHAGTLRDAIWFGRTEPVADRVRLAYRLNVDEYNGRERVQMVVQGIG